MVLELAGGLHMKCKNGRAAFFKMEHVRRRRRLLRPRSPVRRTDGQRGVCLLPGPAAACRQRAPRSAQVVFGGVELTFGLAVITEYSGWRWYDVRDDMGLKKYWKRGDPLVCSQWLEDLEPAIWPAHLAKQSLQLTAARASKWTSAVRICVTEGVRRCSLFFRSAVRRPSGATWWCMIS